MKIDIILTIQDQNQKLINETSLKSIFKYIEKLNSVIIINLNKDLVIDDSNEKVTLIQTDKNTKLEKLDEAKKILSKKKENTHIIVLDADDELINLDEFFALDVSDDLILTPHIYFKEGIGMNFRSFSFEKKNWGDNTLFPYYGNQSMIVSKAIFCESMNDIESKLWQRGEDGFRMIQYFSKATKIKVFNVPFTKFNRFDNVKHTSLISNDEFDEMAIEGINNKFDEFARLVNENKINLWHFSQWNWFEISYKKYESLLNKDVKDKVSKCKINKLNNSLKLVLTIFKPLDEELEEWASYNLGRDLIILNDNPNLPVKTRDKISDLFPNSQFLETGVNNKRFRLISIFTRSIYEKFDFVFKIVDPDDFIYLDGYKKMNEFISKGLFPKEDLVLHKGTKIMESKKDVKSLSKEELVKISTDPNFRMTFATFQTTHKSNILRECFEKLKDKEFTTQFQDDRLITFLYLSNGAKVSKVDIPLYIQFHKNGETKNTFTSRLKQKRAFREVYQFALKNMDIIACPTKKGKEGKIIKKLNIHSKVKCVSDVSELVAKTIEYDNKNPGEKNA